MPPSDLSTLPFDCLRFVFDKVSARDLLHLRETTRTLRRVIIEYLDLVFLPLVGFPCAEEPNQQWHLGWTVSTVAGGVHSRRTPKIWPTSTEELENLNPLQISQDSQILHSPTPFWFGLRTIRAAQIFLMTADIIERRIRLKWQEWDHHRPSSRHNDWRSSQMHLLFNWVFFRCTQDPSDIIVGLLRHPSIRQDEFFHVLPLADFIIRGWRVFPDPITLTYAIRDPVFVDSDIDPHGVSLYALLTGLRALSPPSPFPVDMAERNGSWVCTFEDSPAIYHSAYDLQYIRPQLDLSRPLPSGQSRMFILVHHFATGGLNERRCEVVGCYTDIEAAGEAMREYGAAATGAATTGSAQRILGGRRFPQGYDCQGEVWLQIRLYPVGMPPTQRFEDHIVWEKKWFHDGRDEVERRWDKVDGGSAIEVEVDRLYEARKHWTIFP